MNGGNIISMFLSFKVLSGTSSSSSSSCGMLAAYLLFRSSKLKKKRKKMPTGSGRHLFGMYDIS